MDEREIRRLTDRIAIQDLLGRYCLAIDGHDVAGWIGCFTESGVFGTPGRAIVGRENLKAYAEVHVRFGTRHITCAPVHEVADDGLSATGMASTIVTAATPRGFRIVMAGLYRDVLQKVDGRWLIAQRLAEFQRLPEEPDLNVASRDPDVAAIDQTLMEAFGRLSQPI